jgi:methyltransferase (TIGR00027 family)
MKAGIFLLNPALKKAYLSKSAGNKYYEKHKDDLCDLEKLYTAKAHLRCGYRIRTVYFDQEIKYAVEKQGIKQFVSLGNGYDCRALRMDCLGEARVKQFLLDLPAVTETLISVVKETVLMRDINHVPCDFTSKTSWWDDLKRKGFDPTQPSIFLIEGLTMHLKKGDLDALLKQVSELMASSSVIIGDYATDEMMTNPMWTKFMKKAEAMGAPWLFTTKSAATFKQLVASPNCGSLRVLDDFKSGPEGENSFTSFQLKMNSLFGGSPLPEHRAFRAIKYDANVKLVKSNGVERGVLVGADGKIAPEIA